MTEITEQALGAAMAKIPDQQISLGHWEPGVRREDMRAALEAAAPHLTAAAAAVRLLEEALHLRMHGERAPGGSETWHDWDTRTEAFLRSLHGGDHD